MKTDWSPIDDVPYPDDPVPVPDDRLIQHAAALGHRHNGLPEVRPYRWRRGEAEREAEIQAQLAAIRARLAP